MKQSYSAQPIAGKPSMHSTNILWSHMKGWLGSLGKPEWGGGCWKEKGLLGGKRLPT